MKTNTLNICLGHQSFPDKYKAHIDLFISPNLIGGNTRHAIVPDELYGPNGDSLSEYAQLLWIYKNADSLARGFEFIRIFHYRRFTSPSPIEGIKSTNGPWITTIKESDLEKCAFCFDRNVSAELYNSPVNFTNGVITQYANTHILEDLLNFTNYLVETDVFSAGDACLFLRMDKFVPASNVGIFSVSNFKLMYHFLEKASHFLNTPNFKKREGYQRRSVGFLLERLHSYLIFQFFTQNYAKGTFGHNIMLSNSALVSSTVDKIPS